MTGRLSVSRRTLAGTAGGCMVDDDGVRIVRGMLWGLLFSVPIWAAAALVVWLVCR